jgi:hypothetical protein
MIPQPFGFIGSIKLKIGMYYQGGIIVYLGDGNVGGGLIAYNGGYNTDALAWGPNGAFTQNEGYGYGYANTQNAYNTLSPASNTALYTAWNATYNGYNDWFLPNVAEAYYINLYKSYFPFWDGGTIWCSQYQIGLGDVNAYAQIYNSNANFYTRSETANRRSIACRYITG